MYCKLNDKLQIYYDKRGEGDPLILIHGNSCNNTMFNKIKPYLSKKHTVYALDLPNYGKSSKVRFYKFEDLADVVCEFIDKLNLSTKATVLGYSDGAIIALLMASRHPDFLKEVFACGANLNPRGMKDYAYYAFKFAAFFTRSKDFKMLVTEPHIDVDELHKITVPVHLIVGQRDFIIREHTLLIKNNIANCTLNILKHQGHLSYIHYSDKVIPTLKSLNL
ncbi:MAG: alpha/beta fold hydrolase [Clostridium sp.]